MQTFLPYDDFAASARVLDSARLGKQRLEALQALRALVLPVYGWSTHPAARMWRGFVPALTAYTVATIDEWTARGNVDATRPFVLEFAPEVEGVSQSSLPMPPWLGAPEFHDSHRSNLVRKVPELYRPLFPDVPDDLPYFWPESGAPEGVDRLMPSEPLVWIVRPRTGDELTEWTGTGIVALPSRSPTGTRSKAWEAQLSAFAALSPGDRLALVRSGLDRFATGTVVEAPIAYGRLPDGAEARTGAEARGGDETGAEAQGSDETGADHDASGLRVAVEFGDEVERSAFGHPVLLQDPRSFFATSAPLT